ncbi:type II toxin-antitoxin system prevent-host-death family antitoxin [Kineococcus sp. NBC_00420]|uniref:type II toxin-antitoxin system Phd/YefM family antitoxin n=1 Tax=Kineococcus sp. NBC_00420 TaxID=2903564 RepID=UPI002E1A5C9B
MKTITARELRNEYARILRELEDAGEGYTITNHGRPVAHITPIAPVPDRLRAFSGIPLSAAASLNAAAGPFDHSEFNRQVAATLDPVARDPYAGRDDEPAADTTPPRRPEEPNSATRVPPTRDQAIADRHRVAAPGPRLDDLTGQIAQERSKQQ